MAECQVDISTKRIWDKYFNLTWDYLFQKSPTLRGLLEQNYGFRREYEQTITELAEDVQKIIAKNQGSNQTINQYIISDFKESTPKYQLLDNLTQEEKEVIIGKVGKIKSILQNEKYPTAIIANHTGESSFLNNLISGFKGSLKYDLIKKYQSEGFQDLVKQDITAEGWKLSHGKLGTAMLKGETLDNLVNDLMGNALGGYIYKKIANLKEMHRIFKYAVGMPAGLILLGNSMVVGTSTYLAGRFGMSALQDTEAVEILLNKYKLLGTEARDENLSLKMYAGDGDMQVVRGIDWLFNNLPDNKLTRMMQGVAKSGWHSIYDFMMDTPLDRLAITDALSKRGITVFNISEFTKALENGTISKDVLNAIGTDAMLYKKDFFTNTTLTTLSRNAFSRWRLFNQMQAFVINKADQMGRGIRKFGDAISSGHIKTYGDFVDSLWHDGPWGSANRELRLLIASMVYSAKMANRMYTFSNTDTDEDKNSVRTKYMMGSNDFISSLDSAFFMRIYTAPFRGLNMYNEYNKVTGNSFNTIDGIKVAALQTLSDITTSILREATTLNPYIQGIKTRAQTGNLDYTNMVVADNFEKLMDGLGRFNMIPGTNIYDQNFIKQDTDFFGLLTFSFQNINNNIALRNQLRDVATVDGMLNDTTGAMQRILMYLPVLSTLGNNTATQYKYAQGLILKDPILKQIYSGTFPKDLLNSELYDKEGKTTLANRLRNELSAFDYTTADGIYQKYIGAGLYDLKDKNNDKKEELFYGYLLDKYGAEELKKGFKQYDVTTIFGDTDKDVIKQRAIARMVAGAEAEVPGSSRIFLSYIANQEKEALAKKALGNPAKFYWSNVPKGVISEIEKAVTAKYYPFLYETDKQSWYKLAQERLGQIDDRVFDGIAKDSSLQKMTNALAFTDLLITDAVKHGDLDIVNMKNVLQYTGKYIKDHQDRLSVIDYTFKKINNLDGDSSIKNAIRMGIVSANIDFINTMKNNPEFYKNNKDVVDKVVHQVWGTVNHINQVGTDLARKDLDDEAKTQYSNAFGKSYTPSPYQSKNYSDWSKAAAKVQPSYGNGGGGSNGSSNGYTPTSYAASFSTPRIYTTQLLQPNIAKIYGQMKQEIQSTQAKGVVTESIKSYPAEFLTNLKYKGALGTRINLGKRMQPKLKAPTKVRGRYGTAPGLPGSTSSGTED